MIEKTNKYGVDMSRSDAYWLDTTGYIHRYHLKRDYKECGCHRYDDDCCCDEMDDPNDFFEPNKGIKDRYTQKQNRRLLLTLRR